MMTTIKELIKIRVKANKAEGVYEKLESEPNKPKRKYRAGSEKIK